MQNQTEPRVQKRWIVGEYSNPKTEDLANPFSLESAAQELARSFSMSLRGTVFAVWDSKFNVESIWIDGLRFNATI